MWGASGVTLSLAPGTGCGRCISRDKQQRILAHSIGYLPDERCAGLPAQLRTMDRNTRPVEILGNLLHCIKSGESASEYTHGKDAWTYRKQHPEEQAIFNDAMTGNSRSESQAVLEAYDFSRFSCVVDVGGGQGLLLKEILLACPSTRGVLFDQSHVIASAQQVPTELAQRCQMVAGSFFDAVPRNGDAYLMKAILHDWDDGKSIEILRTCRRAMSPGAALIVIERIVGSPNESPDSKFSDLNMMIQYAALERTRQEFHDLLKGGGFELAEVVPTRSPMSVIVGKPASAA